MDLTIIIPTRDRNAVVQCVHALEHNEAEIIVVDDASDDPVTLPEPTRVIRLDRQRGRSAAINAGLAAASHDAVLVMNDDIYAAPDMVMRLMSEFSAQKRPKLGLKSRIMWDPDVPLTMTMKWMEGVHKAPSPILLSKKFILEHGGYDENFARSEDTELQLRLTQHGLEVLRLESAVGFQHNKFTIHDLVEREFMDGMSSVFLHAKFPQYMPQVEEIEILAKNETKAVDAKAVVEEIAMMEQSGVSELPQGASELYSHVCRHYFHRGIFDGLKDIGGMKPRRNSSSTTAIYREASHLEAIAEFDEARRLFRLVLHRKDEQYWDGAEYHLGCIERALGNPARAYEHFNECLRRNPTHNKARRELSKPERYGELAANVFERIGAEGPPSVLFILFGDVDHVVQAFPTVAALRDKFGNVAWLTAPEYSAIARSSLAGAVHDAKSRGVIPWEWIHEQGFTHVYFPEPAANQEEWERSGLHAIDFIAKKCGVALESRQSCLMHSAEAILDAEDFLQRRGLTRNEFVTASLGNGELRHWPNSNLNKLAKQIGLQTVVFGRKGDPEIPDAITTFDMPLDVMAVLIEWSRYYLGPAYGTSWLATTTDTPMAVFFDPREYNSAGCGFRDVLAGEKNEIREWDIYTNLQAVLEHIESTLVTA